MASMKVKSVVTEADETSDDFRPTQFPGIPPMLISWRQLPILFCHENPPEYYLIPISDFIGENLEPKVGAIWASGVKGLAKDTFNVVMEVTSQSDFKALENLMQQWLDTNTAIRFNED
jgi:hypothetical protein